ncbi:hypothetical protein TNCV_2270401 [Trichonephila clavipes]|nr:hypothetical protein TNCV_2270401 [Trichonephila clavipes]
MLTVPVSTASAEKSFSKLKLIKTYLRSTMSQERLSALSVLSTEAEIAAIVSYDIILKKCSEAKTENDEAHFWLNGYVNKQNCRIWSEANPQVYVETPLHPEKLTVWCALWAGGILLQKR